MIASKSLFLSCCPGTAHIFKAFNGISSVSQLVQLHIHTWAHYTTDEGTRNIFCLSMLKVLLQGSHRHKKMATMALCTASSSWWRTNCWLVPRMVPRLPFFGSFRGIETINQKGLVSYPLHQTVYPLLLSHPPGRINRGDVDDLWVFSRLNLKRISSWCIVASC